ncbi:hypothetical protein BASA83_000257 [Batrachochytrium salamandrivorans]|nr:hypothetical protein BASA83_000257 [Batrachochytrium salamandrivorans]
MASTTSAPAKEAPLPMHFSLLAGAIAGVTEIITMYPLDVVKTRFQIQVGNTEYKSIADCFRKIIKAEGAAALYRGLAVMTGVSAGITEALLVTTPELVKIRMQDKRNAGLYKGSGDVVSKIMKQEGFLTFGRGLEATMWRHGAWNGGYFGVITLIRSNLPKAESKEGVLLNNFIAGAIGGTVGTIINTPFDVAKTRVQSQMTLPLKYNWTLPAIATIAREEGVGALYKGFMPKVLRLGPGGGILLVVFDFVSGYIRKNFM